MGFGGGGGSQQSSDPKAAQRVLYKEQQKRKTNEVDARGNTLYKQRVAAGEAATSGDEWLLAYEKPIENPDAPLLDEEPERKPGGQQTGLLR